MVVVIVAVRTMVIVAVRTMIVMTVRPIIVMAVRPIIVMAIRPIIVVAVRTMIVRFNATNPRIVCQAPLTIAILDILFMGIVMIMGAGLSMGVIHFFSRMSTGAVTVGLMPPHGAQYIGQANHHNAQCQQSSRAGCNPPERRPTTCGAVRASPSLPTSYQPGHQEHVKGQGYFQGQDGDIRPAVAPCTQVYHCHERPGYDQDYNCDADYPPEFMTYGSNRARIGASLAKRALQDKFIEDAAAYPGHRPQLVHALRR